MVDYNSWAARNIQFKCFCLEVLPAMGRVELTGQFVQKIVARHETFSDFKRLYL
jgi:hypothetical protein